jgi:Polyketide cyclase / dehydrase and lipid transport
LRLAREGPGIALIWINRSGGIMAHPALGAWQEALPKLFPSAAACANMPPLGADTVPFLRNVDQSGPQGRAHRRMEHGMYKVLVEKTLDLPRKKVFDILVEFGGLEKILPDMIESCKVTGTGIGASRDVMLKGGGRVTERLDVAYDGRVFAYSITFNDALPFDNYCAVVTLEDAGGKTVARWGSNWIAKGITDEQVKGMLTDLYTNLLNGLHKLA